MIGYMVLENAANKFNSLELGNYKFDFPLDGELPLYGVRTPLDSLGFTAFLMAVEDEIENQTGKPVNLTSIDIMDRAFTIFLNIKTLACFIDGLNGNLLQEDC